MTFFRLFRTIILRHFRFEWGKLSLSVLGVTIGVTAFVAIRLANTTAFHAFTASLDAVAGRANLQLLSNDGLGFDEGLIARLRGVKAVGAAAPVIEQYAEVADRRDTAKKGGRPVLVFGVDVFAEDKFRTYQFQQGESGGAEGLRFLLDPRAIIITTKLAREFGLQRGDSIPLIANGRRVSFIVEGIVEPTGTASALGGDFALLDIASAQEAFDRVGKLDRIDLLVPDNDRENVKEYLAGMIPPGLTLQEPQNRGAQTTKMIDAFDLNLTALAFIALFVSMFIIYNTMLTNTLRRRRELGILRAVGATRGLIVALFLAEAALIGLIGVGLGLPLGILLARLALEQVVKTVTALYILTVARDIIVDPLTLAIGGAVGVLASIVSAIPSAVEASRAHPRETFSVQTLEAKVSLSYGRIVIASVLILASAFIASLQGQKLMSPMMGFAGAGLLLVGTALLAPVFIRVANLLFGRMVKRLFGVEGELANAYLLQSLGRTSTAVAALMTAIAMLIGISTMVGSFRQTVQYWMNQTVTADLFMTVSVNRLSADSQAPIPGEVTRYLDSLPEARTVESLRWMRLGYGGRTIALRAASLKVRQQDATVLFQHGEWNQVMRGLDTGAIAVSESFALRFDKGIGDTIVLATPTGPRSLPVAGVYYDYTSDAGSILMKKPRFVDYFHDSVTTNVAIYLRDRSRIDAIRDTIERRFAGEYSLITYSNRALREEAITIFDQTFAITYALQLVAVIVAAIGVANTLAALVVERSREIGILKAIGATAGQVRKMTLVQAGLIGIASQTLGIGAGLGLSAILIYVINRVSFGWTIQFQISPVVLLTSSVLVIVTAFIAGIAPANAAARKRVAEVVTNE